MIRIKINGAATERKTIAIWGADNARARPRIPPIRLQSMATSPTRHGEGERVMFEEYTFTQTLNGYIVRKNAERALYANEIWVFNSMDEMGQWVCDNFKPAQPLQSQRGE